MPAGLLHHGLEQAAEQYPSRVAIRAGGDEWTFADLERSANLLASRLSAKGVASGHRVAIMSSNRPEFLVAVEAISKLGGSAVLLNPAWKSLEVTHALGVAEAVHAIGDGTSAELLTGLIGRERVTDLDDASLESGAAIERPVCRCDAEADVLLVFSSGTTGLPKAVRHTHRSMGAAIDHWRVALGLSADDLFQVATPPSHILGLLNLVTAVASGAAVRLHRRFDLDEVLHHIEAERMTLEMAVAPIALAMANHPDLERYDLSSLRFIMWGATPVTPSVAEIVTKRTGVRWLPAYGASELPVIAANPVEQPSAWRLDSAGLPPESVELRVVNLDSGRIVPPGEVGEIQARSPSLMAGYLPAEANEEAFSDGWYRTGDVGWLEPEGWVHLTDRSKEMIKVSGFQVAPAEIEGLLLGHPGVVDCAVFAVADERAGELPVAAVQLAPGQPVNTEELVQLVSDSLASYKRLYDLVVVDVVPRLPSGKVLRRVLREEWEPRIHAGRSQA